MMKNCIDIKSNCQYCFLRNLYKSYRIFENDCYISLLSLSNALCMNLNMYATPACVEHSYIIIDKFNLRLCEILGADLFIQLCSDTLAAYIALGVPNLYKAYEILQFFKIVLYNDNYIINNRMEMKRLYYLEQFQLLQLQRKTENYKQVDYMFKHLEDKDIICDYSRVHAQWTASLYLLGRDERSNKLKESSKYEVEYLYDSIKDDNNFTSFHYFTLAKLIEHYTETCMYKSVEYVTNLLKNFFDKSLIDNRIFNLDEAVNKTIFHRDAFRALKMIDAEGYEKHLEIAKRIAKDYVLIDQQIKIEQIEKDWQNRKLHARDDVIKVTTKLNSLVGSHFKNEEPYIFISYGHADFEKVEMDFKKLITRYNCWIDFENIDGGRDGKSDNWVEKVKPVLENELCKGIIVYCSKESIEYSRGALLEAEWIYNHKKSFFTFLIDFDNDITPKNIAEFLTNKVNCYDRSDLYLRIISAYSYILQATTNEDRYSYYHLHENSSHLNSNDFKNWITKQLKD